MKKKINLVTFRTFDNPINAHITKTKLESQGIECFLFDEYINTLNPLFNVTVGGIKLKIRSEDTEDAENIIREVEVEKSLDENDRIIECPKCNSQELYSGFKSMKGLKGVLSAIVSFALMVYPVYYKTVYRCKNCGFEFKEMDNKGSDEIFRE